MQIEPKAAAPAVKRRWRVPGAAGYLETGDQSSGGHDLNFRQAVVVGAGTMGRGIAQVLLEAGLHVGLHDASGAVLQAAVDSVRKRVRRRRERGEIGGDPDEIDGRLRALAELSDLAGTDLAIEAVPERLDLKQDVLARLDAVLPPGAVLASNTSGLDLSALAGATGRPHRVVGLHFFNPPPAMPLVEIIAAPRTSPEVVTAVAGLARRCGKTPIEVGNRPGFAVNRLLFAMVAEAVRALEEGVASAEDLDRAVRLGAGHPIGPLALADFVGLDVCLDILESLEARLGPRYAPPGRLRRLVAEGRLGRKTGGGFFDY